MKKLILFLLLSIPMLVFSQQSVKSGLAVGTPSTGVVTISNAELKTLDGINTASTIQAQLNGKPSLADTIRLSTITTVPTIYTAAGDTSNVPVPIKIGNIFIDTTNSKVYISKSAIRGGWLKLN